jgi:hypothetical protein
MTMTAVWMWRKGLPKPHLPAFCHPFRNQQQALLTRVGQVISNRLEVIQSDWEDDLEDGRPDTDIFDNKHRSRVREVNAILCALQREFSGFTFPDGLHPLDLREDVKSNVSGRGQATQMPSQKACS